MATVRCKFNPNSKQYSMNTFEINMFSSISFLSLLDHVIIKGAWEHPGFTRSDAATYLSKHYTTYTC
jgi:hypothetical protein